MMHSYRLLLGDCRETLKTLPDESVHCVVTSPPYWGLRDYGVAGQIGLEPTLGDFLDTMLQVFEEVRRVLRKDGTLWLNMGDAYAGSWGSQGRQGNTGQMAGRAVADARDRSKIQAARLAQGIYPSKLTNTGSLPKGTNLKSKDLMGLAWRLAFALQDAGWWLRQDIIWHKPNPMPESAKDRCTKAHEYIFLLSKSARYYYDAEAIKEPLSGTAHPRAAAGAGNIFAHNLDHHHAKPGNAVPARPRSFNGIGFGHGHDNGGKGKERWVPPAGWDQGASGTAHGTIHKDGRRKSGNKERKPGSARGCPEGTGSNVNGSVPWEGTKRNKRSVWTIPTAPFKGAHFATFPPALVMPCVLAGSPPGGTVLDPFGGSGTTAGVANALGREAILCELSPEYAGLIPRRVEEIKGYLREHLQIPLPLAASN